MTDSTTSGSTQGSDRANGRQFSAAVQGATTSGGSPAGPKPPWKRNYIVTLALGFFLGFYGADRFYLGKYGTAVLKLFTAGGFLIWSAIDLYTLTTGRATDRDGNIVTYEGDRADVVRVLSWVATGLVAFTAAIFVLFLFIGSIVSIVQAS